MKRRGFESAFLLGVAAATAALLWRQDADSFRTTWELVAAGSEPVRPAAMMTVWDGRLGILSPYPSVALVIARLAGPALAGPSYVAFVTLLGFGWGEGARRLAIGLRAGRFESLIAAAVTIPVVANVAGGRTGALGAAGFLWLLLALRAERGILPVAASLLTLAALSPAGFLFGVALVVLDRTLRPGRRGAGAWILVVAAMIAWTAAPRPEWTWIVRFDPGPYLSEGPYGARGRSIFEAILFPFAGGRPSGLFVAAGVAGWALAGWGALRAGVAARGLFAISAALVALCAGAGADEVVASPARVATAVLPGLSLQAYSGVAGTIAGALLLAASARAPVRAQLLLAALLAAAIGIGRGEIGSPAPVPEAIAVGVAAGEAGTLALPLSVENDLRWRRRMPGNRSLRNGLQALLDRNAPVLAAELDEATAASTGDLLSRLGIERVVVAESRAAAFGDTLVSAQGESLVRVVRGEEPEPPCLSPVRWRARSSIGNPEVSIPRLAFDGDPATRWGSGEPQRPGQFFEIDLGEPVRLLEVDLSTVRFETDHPRGIRVEVSPDGESWSVVESRDPWPGELAWAEQVAYYDGGANGRTRIRLGGSTARWLRIVQTGRTPRMDWSIVEICVRAESLPGDGDR